jgi:kynurenine 3-monooxygenase
MPGRSSSPDVAIVGAGLVGSLAAIFLTRRGLCVTVHERLPDPRSGRGPAGRSINLVVASRGLRALEDVGLRDGVLSLTVAVAGRMIHSLDGELSYQPYGRDASECNYSVSRAELNRFLISEAERSGVRFEFGAALSGADFENGRLEFGSRTVVARRAIGADGAGSAVRAALMERPEFHETAELLDHGYKELVIPADANGGFRIAGHALHIWPRGRMMLMALPNLDGSFTVTLYLPHEGESSFASLVSEARVRELFERQFPDAVPLLDDPVASMISNPTGNLGTVRCWPWNVRDRVLLVGDAAHAIVPFFGQGMNCGFEDCRVLDELLAAHGDDWERVFALFGEARKPDADAIADMALDNFLEMRDRVTDPRFLLRKQVEHLLEERFPREYRSRYSMVMYGSRIPYRVALEAGEIQQRILDRLCRGLTSATEVDDDEARRLIRERLTPYLERRGASLDY